MVPGLNSLSTRLPPSREYLGMPQEGDKAPEERVTEALLAELKTRGGAPLGDLVGSVSLRLDASKSVVAKSLYSAAREGRAVIGEPMNNVSKLETFYSPRNLEFWVLSLIPLATGLAILGGSISTAVDYIRVVFGSVSVLVLPGYGVIGTLYLRRELSNLQIFVFSVAASLAIVPLVGVMLNYSPWGISLDSLLISFLIIDETLLVGSSIRRILYPSLGRISGPQHRAN